LAEDASTVAGPSACSSATVSTANQSDGDCDVAQSTVAWATFLGMSVEANRALVLSYIVASQRARSTGLDEDFAAVRGFLADDVVISLASAWADEPFVVAHRGADAVVARLRESVNSGSRLKTENQTIIADEDNVFVEQFSTVLTDDGPRRSAVAFVFAGGDGAITSIKTFRNNLNLPV
jgi:hypothetical protein